jgi:DNA-binding NarL/FixJ family response regulator
MSGSSQEVEQSALSAPGVTSAEQIWCDIVAGRLVVEQHRDENGRRYLHVRAPKADRCSSQELTERERLVLSYRAYGQGLKKIAFELGVSVPTVARILASARAKLGLNRDLELPLVFGGGMRTRRRA